jgi:hypothetical protein
VVLKAVVEPVILGAKTDQHASRAPVPGDYDLLVGSLSEIAGEVIFDLGQSYLAGLVYPPARANSRLRSSR